jgi:hypothetical protein
MKEKHDPNSVEKKKKIDLYTSCTAVIKTLQVSASKVARNVNVSPKQQLYKYCWL